jgi:hypothetical protein
VTHSDLKSGSLGTTVLSVGMALVTCHVRARVSRSEYQLICLSFCNVEKRMRNWMRPSSQGMLGVCLPQVPTGGSACSFEVSRRSEWLCMGSIFPLAYWDLMIIPNAVFSSAVPAHNPASSFHVSVGNIIEMTSMTAKIVVLGAPRSTRSPGHH